MLYHIVISHNQTEHISKFPKGSVFVFDDPTGADTLECDKYGNPYVLVPQTGNRGMNRNAGLSYVLSHYNVVDDDIIEFFDGDRFPKEYNPTKVIELMDKHNLSVMLYSCEHDKRHHKIYVPLSNGATIVDTGTLCNPFYSCGFAIRVSALKKIMEYNDGYFFEPRFTRWGSEDQYIGLVCDYLNLKVAITLDVMLNGNVGGDELKHPDYRESLQQYIDIVMARNLPIRNQSRPFETI